ncbi:MAG: hypothetical protein GY875_03485 [Gammaproteobacteria bacterium]|nr:hypothetical protein [Gammaproteobacteria bacterium]
MEINPGGKLSLEDIVGRDEEIERYWQVLSRQGLVLSAERRIGKTHITMKMRAQCRAGYMPIYQDLEAIHSITELVRSVYSAVSSYLSPTKQVLGKVANDWAKLLPKRIGNLDLPSARDNWRLLLDNLFDDILNVAGDKVILMMWDEFPLMLYNLRKREDDAVVIEFLDYLRMLRQTRADNLRFLLTGSIGLHLVIRTLHLSGNANDPVNDMYQETVPPMKQDEAEILCRALLAEMDVVEGSTDNCVITMAKEVEGFPYYIHHVADQLQQLGRAVDIEDIDNAIDLIVCDERDPAHFAYYAKRIITYYGAEKKQIAISILDILAGKDAPVTLDDLLNLFAHTGIQQDKEILRTVLQLLVEDHYLSRTKVDSNLVYQFRWSLVKRWWKENRL